MASGKGAMARAKADLSTVVRGFWFTIPAALLTAGFAALGAILAPDAKLWERIVSAIAGTLGGALLLGTLAFLVLIAMAPTRQRNEAREALTTTTEDAVRTRAEAEDRRVTMRVEADARVARAEQERDATLRRVEEARLLSAPPPLIAWLDDREREIRALQRQPDDVPHACLETYDGVRVIENGLANVSDAVSSKLRLEAPQYVEEFETNPRWFHPEVNRSDPEDREQVNRLLDHTAHQLYRIRESLR